MKPLSIRVHKRLSGLALAAALAAPACGSQPTSTDDVGAVGSAEAALISPTPSGNRLDAITDILGSLSLTASQQAQVDALAAAARTRHASVKAADDALRAAVAAEVSMGKIDRASLSPELRTLSAATTTAHTADLAALVTLHAVLDDAQRNQFIDALEARRGHRAHGGHFNGHRPGFWGKFLALTDEQRTEIRDTLRSTYGSDGGAGRQRFRPRAAGHALLEAFRSPTFGAADVADLPFGGAKRADFKLEVLAATIPVLTDAQRAKLAEKILHGKGNP